MNAESEHFMRISEIGQANLQITKGGSRPRILIVDDSPTIRYSLRKDLEQMGAIVSEATNGNEGLRMVESLELDLIITDVEMPEMDGFAFCAEIKRHPVKNSIPVVILSSREKEEDIEFAFKVGASNYITKSNARDNIRTRVKEILEKRSLLNGRTVLVVDDSPSIRNLIDKALTKAGFQVILAENGREALDLLGKYSPDMVVSDLHMPVLDGLGLCKIVHSNKEFSQIPFIIMSSDDDRAKMRQLLEYGASAYLVKPFNIDQLVITAERFLSDHFNRVLRERKHLESEQQMLIASISSLVLALEARDQYTSGHSESVATLSVNIAREMNMDEGRIARAKMAGKLHDIGKIGIRDDILLKPGPLNDEEMTIIKLHPSIGADILSPIQSLADIIPAIRSHHERIDGKGYPEGLKGEQIPLLARMVAVADTYDALTSDRPYRKGFSKEDALAIIEKAKGTQLCPECVRIFLKALEKDKL
ncbi:MAG: response regulator [Syntrophobacteraceae bacterium]|nr:response regulator [Syntrophobacteraceae bacterium]